MNYLLPAPIRDQLINYCSKNLTYENAVLIINTLSKLEVQQPEKKVEKEKIINKSTTNKKK